MRKTFKWYRVRGFSRTHSAIGTVWYHKEKLKKLHFKLLAKQTHDEIPFPIGGYRHTSCAACRNDMQRWEIAAVSDRQSSENYRKTVQHLKCHTCRKLLPWWWFSKLPLDKEEQEIVTTLRGGKAW